jgi:hypothetical protein
VDFDDDGLAVDADKGGAANRGEHGTPPVWIGGSEVTGGP